MNHFYGGVDEPEIKIIDDFACKLRAKLSAVTGVESHIGTIWGHGYVMRDPIHANMNDRKDRDQPAA